ncbi:PAS domain S-box protein [Aquabacterium sp. J223]|uniref:hybrid sensor histidine kinase/response regulator n=1 Tax=Aquabacterium sp. J223 TaxID=2898431 RepID=UPI0021AE1273|nr:PAS domain S-box protein [Aquabacterium sp. J223]UUX96934.1 PAS domain S-box protein [Aquabacterium sp. J223]
MPSPPASPQPLDRMDAAVRAAGVGVWLNPLPLGELVWNENTKAHFHLPPDARPTIELFFERLHADDRERVRHAVTRAVEEGTSFDEVYRTVSPGGDLKWIHAIGRLVRGEDGQARQFDGITLDITGPVSAQQQLRYFADSAPAMLWVTDSEGRCTFLSRAWTDFTGQPEVEGLGFGWLEKVHSDDRPRAEAAFLDATARQASFALEHRVRRADGRWAWVIDAGRPRVGSGGEFLGFAGSVTDIDDRRRAEDALRRSSDRYAQLLESIDEGFCIVQVLLDGQRRPVDYRFVETNPLFERQTGLHRPVGRTARELVPGLEEFWFETYGEVALRRLPRRFTHGSQAMGRWFDVFASPIGEPVELLVAILFRDVTDRMLQERRLRDSEERYRGFLASSTEGIWRMEFDPPVDTALPPERQVDAIFDHGRFAECNHVLARMYDLASPDDLVGKGLSMTMDRDEPQARAYLLGLIAAGYRAAEVESLEHDREGRPVWFANNLSGVIENGLLVRAWGTQRDITDRKRAEAALMEADQRKDEFLATLAHELRNPLAPIRSAAELLRRRGGDDALLSRHAGMIGRQVSHLARMIDDLMDVSRVTRGRLELRLAPVVLQDVVRAALDNAQELLQAGRHPVTLRLPEAPVRLLGDEVRLVQVVQNLLTNAARYSADGRPVTVTVEAEGGQARLRVRDQGVGIAPEQMTRLFELFWQGGVAADRAGGGLGIGLSLVRRLAELHGGTVQAHSGGLGQGSEFVVRLPLVPAATDTSLPAVADPAAARACTVLLVDDNRDAADTLAEVLRLSGYEVATAYDGVEGLAVAQSLRPDVAVLDLGMPRLDGYATCRALRERPQGRDMTVLALSGWGQAADQARAADAGFDAHLIKPVDPDTLVQAIEAARRRR